MLDSVHRRADSTQPFCGAVDILLLVIVCVEKMHKLDDVLRIMMSLLTSDLSWNDSLRLPAAFLRYVMRYTVKFLCLATET